MDSHDFPFKSENTDGLDPQTSSRRTVRNRTKSKKYGVYLEETPSKHDYKKSEQSSDEDMNETICLPKPTELFGSDDVEGQDIFKFKSRHTKQDLQNKVKEAISQSPKYDSPLRTPRRLHPGLLNSPVCKKNPDTPKQVKDIIKKRIIQEVESDSAASDFSESSSDFVPEEDENESEISFTSSEEEESSKPAANLQTFRYEEKPKPKDTDYVVTPDNYFIMNASKKIATSDHTLAALKNLNIENIETNIQLSEEHRQKIIDLNETYRNLFNRWLFVLSENFNIILYGIGSKRSILHLFQMEKLQNFPCIVVNGFFPSLTMKSILETIVIDFLEYSHVSSNVGDVVNLIDTQLSDNQIELFLIIHNIDGTPLRNAKAQATLASLSQIKNLHMIATIDHINAPLLWDHTKLSKFKFTWWDVTTFMPYTEETSYENSLISQRSGALQLSSLRSVFQSLNSNAKGIFKNIIEYQLENKKKSHYLGMPFTELYMTCRVQFLVSSEESLKAQLTEFIDHKLVKMKRTLDGSENLVIPIETSLLQQFLEQQTTD